MKRRSGIELLRIIAMFMIVAFHFTSHVQWGGDMPKLNTYWLELFGSFGRIGVSIFFIISGYFIATQKKHNWKKIFKILRPTWFYSILFFSIFLLLKDDKIFLSFPLSTYITKSFFPIITNAYWFISSYIILILISPYLKKSLDVLDDKEILKLIGIFFVATFIAKCFNLFLSNTELVIMDIPIAIFYAIIGYFIKRVEPKIKSSAWSISGILFSLLLLIISPLIIHLMGYVGISLPKYLFNNIYSPACIIFSTSIFIVFSRLNFVNKIINYISSLVFGIYLIHENIFVAYSIWNTNRFVNISAHGYDFIVNFICYSLLISFAVFGISAILEMIRKTSLRIIKYVCNI